MAADRVVVIVPLGNVDEGLVKVAKEAIEARVNAEVRVDPKRELPKEAWYAPRKRWRAEKLIEALKADPPKDAWKIVGLTEAEISTTKGDVYDWGIAGLGDINGPACVGSALLYRKFSKTRAVLERRFADNVVHELGHTLGMPHCESDGCVMADAKGRPMQSADASDGDYCEVCRKRAEPGVLKPRKASK
ncbi:MAG: hypothetical protein QM723_30365 [Myxococcaceae bacterium]